MELFLHNASGNAARPASNHKPATAEKGEENIMTPEQLRGKTKVEILEAFQPSRCASCGTTLHETTTGNRLTSDGCMCSDCYFVQLGKEIEEHPIGVPRRRRGS
jgi:hypothetical protein